MYAVGFREAVLKYYDNNHTYKDTCRNFHISPVTLRDWLKRREAGSLEANYRGTQPKLDRAALKRYVDGHPDAYQHEMAEALGCSQSCICYNLKKIGYTCKKKTSAMPNRTR